METTRRQFMQTGIGAATLMASGWTLPGFLGRTAMAAEPGDDNRILIVVQMTGGNDGLNMVIPYRDDRYHRARPTIGIAESEALPLSEDLALHPQMTALKRLFDDQRLQVVSNVGYPNPNRSHFRSMDIWQTASTHPEHATTGWIGRVVDRGGHTEHPLAMNIDDGPLPLAMRSADQTVPSIRSVDAFRLDQRAQAIREAIAQKRKSPPDDLLFVQRLAVTSCASAERLSSVTQGDDRAIRYPDLPLARHLHDVATLIRAGFGARVYYTSIGGFDTHANQNLTHGQLLGQLSESLAAFLDDLKAAGLDDRVLMMTFSEFGRRVKENGSRGTDHGAAAPMFIAGSPCRAGIVGHAPALGSLEDGDVRHEIDFRRVYAELLEHWLGVPQEPVLGARYEPLGIVRRS